jgi:hypothetical protein
MIMVEKPCGGKHAVSLLRKGDRVASKIGAHLVLRLSQQLLLSEVVQSQGLADSRQ